MEKLIEARKIISEADKQIAELFQQRMNAVKQVAEYKKERGLPVFDASREDEVIRKNMEYIEDEELREFYLSFIRETMSVSKDYQRKIIEDTPENDVIRVEHTSDVNSYDIILERGALKKAGELLGIPEGRKVLVVTDTGVPRIYADTVAWCYEDSHIFIFPEGEKSKNFDTYRAICQTLSDAGFTRHDAVIAVGGGVVGDMAGFAAATYMRGIDFYNIPTTLLSQVDSSIGGKTAIDLGKIKNIIGAFHQPKKVIIDPDVLCTLPNRQLSNGLAESIKMAACFDKELFEIFLKEDYMDHIEEIIEASLKIKRYVVEQDEKETGLRKVLNFGHTIGHGIEASIAFGELYHGECVALGMLAMCSENVRSKMLTALKNVGLPTEYKYDKEKVFEALCHDKKSQGESITVIKCDEIGTFRFLDMTKNELKNLI